jgi:hypothetical protein
MQIFGLILHMYSILPKRNDEVIPMGSLCIFSPTMQTLNSEQYSIETSGSLV